MGKCKLCKKYEADKKGSHIVPHFLLKRIDNIEEKKGRDYELGFVIGESNTTSYFGRSLQPEELDKTFGELTEEENQKNSNPSIVDEYFCTSCEKRLSVIEAEYAKTLKKYSNETYKSGCSSELGLLFWISVVWRMSIHGIYGVRLAPGEEETCRRILDRCLAPDKTSINVNKMRVDKDLKRISYKLMRAPNYSDNHSTFLFFNPLYRHPYSILIDEYILLFSLKSNYVQLKDFYGLKDEISQAPINKVGIDEKILPIENEKLNTVNTNLINKIKDIRVGFINKYLDNVYNKLGGVGKGMPPQIKQEVFDEITSDQKKIGRKYTHDDLVSSVMKVLSQYIK